MVRECRERFPTAVSTAFARWTSTGVCGHPEPDAGLEYPPGMKGPKTRREAQIAHVVPNFDDDNK